MNVRDWVAALRSGKYNQTENYLRYPTGKANQYGYCCLGVLCNEYNPKKWSKTSFIFNPYGKSLDYKIAYEANGDYDETYLPGYLRHALESASKYFPEDVAEDLDGIVSNERVRETLRPYVIDEGVPDFAIDMLTYLNDNGMSFEEIASFVEDVFNLDAEITEYPSGTFA